MVMRPCWLVIADGLIKVATPPSKDDIFGSVQRERGPTPNTEFKCLHVAAI
jgi:hypothetical protein